MSEEALRRAVQFEAARRKALAPQQKPPLGQRIKTAIMGDDDPTTQTIGEKIATGLNVAGESLTLGLIGDEANAAFDSMIGRGSYDERLAHYRGQEEVFKQDNPVAAVGAELAPAAIPGLGAFSWLSSGGRLMRTTKAAGVAGLSAGIYGFAEGEGGVANRASRGMASGIAGAAFGAAVPVLGRLTNNALKAALKNRKVRQMIDDAPTLEELRNKAGQIFERLDNNTTLDRLALTDRAGSIRAKAERAGLDEVLTPQSTRALERLEDAATTPNAQMGFRELDVLRRQAQVPAASNNPVEANIGQGKVRGIDDILDRATQEAGGEAAEARRLWGQLRKSEVLDEAIYRASNYQSGFQSGLRAQFRRILNDPNKRKRFSKEEVKAIEAVVQGDEVTNAARDAGKTGRGLMAMLAMREFGLATPVLGRGLENMSERVTARNAEIARAMVAGGAQLEDPAMEAARRIAVDKLLTRMGARGGEMAGPTLEAAILP